MVLPVLGSAYALTLDIAAFVGSLSLSDQGVSLSINQTLTLAGTATIASGTLVLAYGGKILCGTVAVSGPSSVFRGAGGTLDGVAFQGLLDLSARYSNLTLTGGGSLAGAGGVGQGTIDLQTYGFAPSQLTLAGAIMTGMDCWSCWTRPRT